MGAPYVKILFVGHPYVKIPYVGAHYVKIPYVGAPYYFVFFLCVVPVGEECNRPPQKARFSIFDSFFFSSHFLEKGLLRKKCKKTNVHVFFFGFVCFFIYCLKRGLS